LCPTEFNKKNLIKENVSGEIYEVNVGCPYGDGKSWKIFIKFCDKSKININNPDGLIMNLIAIKIILK